jgi:hypothetical protein
MITIRYIDPYTKESIEETLDDSVVNVPEYTINLHKNYLCKDYCNGENCKIWLKTPAGEYILMGVAD